MFPPLGDGHLRVNNSATMATDVARCRTKRYVKVTAYLMKRMSTLALFHEASKLDSTSSYSDN